MVDVHMYMGFFSFLFWKVSALLLLHAGAFLDPYNSKELHQKGLITHVFVFEGVIFFFKYITCF